MHYDFVARTILGGFTGQANSLQVLYLLVQLIHLLYLVYLCLLLYNASNMNVHALLIDAKTNIVYNANTVPLSSPTAVKQLASEKLIVVYPNPAKK